MAKRKGIRKRKTRESPLRLFKQFAEYRPLTDVGSVPSSCRGLYVLYKCRPKKKRQKKDKYDVVYVGMTTAKMIRRLKSHARKKKDLWTHFSAFEVWENIRNEEIVELEGLFRHLYRKDSRANALNSQRKFKKMEKIRQQNFTNWIPISKATKL